MKRWPSLLLLPLPLLTAALAWRLERAKGPYWLSANLDPAYVYLLNGGNLAALRLVGHVDHPGTPLQALAALTIRGLHALSAEGDSSWRDDLLRRPERYGHALFLVLLLLNVMAQVALGLAAATAFGHVGWGWWLQIAPLASPLLMNAGLTRLTPEPLLLLASTLMATLLVWAAAPGSHALPPRLLLMLALVCGFGIACKVTFAPLLLVPLLAGAGWRDRLRSLAGAAAAFVFFTLPILPLYPDMLKWMARLFLHVGHYGSGRTGVISWPRAGNNLAQSLQGQSFFLVALLLGALAWLAGALLRRRQDATARLRGRLLGALLAAQLASLLMVAKHAGGHYLLPALSLSGITLLLAVAQFGTTGAARRRGGRVQLLALALVAVAVAVPVQAGREFRRAYRPSGRGAERALAQHHQLEARYRGYAKVYAYPSSAPAYALKFGNDLARGRYSAELARLFPDTYFFDIWRQRFGGFAPGRDLTIDDIRARSGGRVVFQLPRGLRIPGLPLLADAVLNRPDGVFVLGDNAPPPPVPAAH